MDFLKSSQRSCSHDALHSKSGQSGYNLTADSGTLTPRKPLSMKDQEIYIDKVRKENFGLKLRIYFLEESFRKNGIPIDKAEVVKENIELKVQIGSLEKELETRNELIAEAQNAIESLKRGNSQQNLSDSPVKKDVEATAQHDDVQLLASQSLATEKLLNESKLQIESWKRKYESLYESYSSLKRNFASSYDVELQDRPISMRNSVSKATQSVDSDKRKEEVELLNEKVEQLTNAKNDLEKDLKKTVFKLEDKENAVKEYEALAHRLRTDALFIGDSSTPNSSFYEGDMSDLSFSAEVCKVKQMETHLRQYWKTNNRLEKRLRSSLRERNLLIREAANAVNSIFPCKRFFSSQTSLPVQDGKEEDILSLDCKYIKYRSEIYNVTDITSGLVEGFAAFSDLKEHFESELQKALDSAVCNSSELSNRLNILERSLNGVHSSVELLNGKVERGNRREPHNLTLSGELHHSVTIGNLEDQNLALKQMYRDLKRDYDDLVKESDGSRFCDLSNTVIKSSLQDEKMRRLEEQIEILNARNGHLQEELSLVTNEKERAFGDGKFGEKYLVSGPLECEYEDEIESLKRRNISLENEIHNLSMQILVRDKIVKQAALKLADANGRKKAESALLLKQIESTTSPSQNYRKNPV
eukprot:Nk52_evm12s155 gene=Nk52_evmTU12s155